MQQYYSFAGSKIEGENSGEKKKKKKQGEEARGEKEKRTKKAD